MAKDKAKDKAKDNIDDIDDTTLDRVMTLAYAFDENKKQGHPKVSWEEIKPELEKLSETELEILLGLVKNKE